MIYHYSAWQLKAPTTDILCYPEDMEVNLPRTGCYVLDSAGKSKFLPGNAANIFSSDFQKVRSGAIGHCSLRVSRGSERKGKAASTMEKVIRMTENDLRVPHGVDISRPCVFLYGVNSSGDPSILAFNIADDTTEGELHAEFHHLLWDTSLWSAGRICSERLRGWKDPQDRYMGWTIPPTAIHIADDACRSFSEAKGALVTELNIAAEWGTQEVECATSAMEAIRKLTPMDAIYAGPAPVPVTPQELQPSSLS